MPNHDPEFIARSLVNSVCDGVIRRRLAPHVVEDIEQAIALAIRQATVGLCDRIAAQSELLTKRSEAEGRVRELEAAIRFHRDQRGDDRCWLDDCTLYAILPEGGTVTSPPMPPPDEMLENCKRFIKLRHCLGEPYVSPQREIERLEKENASLVALLTEALPILRFAGPPALAGRVESLPGISSPDVPPEPPCPAP